MSWVSELLKGRTAPGLEDALENAARLNPIFGIVVTLLRGILADSKDKLAGKLAKKYGRDLSDEQYHAGYLRGHKDLAQYIWSKLT